MPDLTRDEVIALTTSPTWVKIKRALEEQRAKLVNRVASGGYISHESVEKTAIFYTEATAEIRMYDEILNLNELLFGPQQADEGD